jgi:hypothetical protein
MPNEPNAGVAGVVCVTASAGFARQPDNDAMAHTASTVHRMHAPVFRDVRTTVSS